MEANLHNNPNRDAKKYSRTLYRVTVNFYKKIRSLQNLVYGKAFLLHWTSSCEKAQLFDKHLVGLGLWTKKEKWHRKDELVPTSIDVSCMCKKEENILCHHHITFGSWPISTWHQLWMMEFCIVVLTFESVDESYGMTIHMKYLWQHSLYILLFVLKHFRKWNMEDTLATNRCERDKDKFPLYKHRQGCALWKVEWIQCSEPVKST